MGGTSNLANHKGDTDKEKSPERIMRNKLYEKKKSEMKSGLDCYAKVTSNPPLAPPIKGMPKKKKKPLRSKKKRA